MKRVLLILGAIGLIAAMLGVAFVGSQWRATQERQDWLAPFYQPPTLIPAVPGTLIRSEPLGVSVPGAASYRVLYSTQRPDGSPAVSSGMVFVPTSPAPSQGRPIVAWAHGTLGQGAQCAPSRSMTPLGDTTNWLNQMMKLGWIVTATDYAGLGTPGPNLYLVAEAEVRDVVNSVRAARNLVDAQAGNRYVVWGHSQGGHSALWSGHLAPELAPEHQLQGVAAAAPAAELNQIMGAPWHTAVGWGIGPEVVQSWPVVNASLPLEGVVSQQGIDNAAELAQECVASKTLMVQLLARLALGQTFFVEDPSLNSSWKAMGLAQTPAPLPASMPVFVGQSTADQVVLAWPNALLQERWCTAGSSISTLWIGEVSHQLTAETIGPEVVRWIADRFVNRTAVRTCQMAPPISADPNKQ
ncbi:MAG: lipase family protein [Actinomycetota bacterium]|nr:lipase family protein [Actinomycetota bacterium]